MHIKKLVVLFFLSWTFAPTSMALYKDAVRSPHIKSVVFYNSMNEQSSAVLIKNNNETLRLEFDELTTEYSTYFYTVEHCDAQWSTSGLSPLQYLYPYFEDQISTYGFSIGTYSKYIHYQLVIPNDNINFKLSGNYILKVYKRGEENVPVLTRRFCVVENLCQMELGIQVPASIEFRKTSQQTSLKLKTDSPLINNPSSDIRAYIVQNRRPEYTLFFPNSLYQESSYWYFTDINTQLFPGDNEFRKADTRVILGATKLPADSLVSLFPSVDRIWSQRSYESLQDFNGGFYLRHPDNRDVAYYGDYVRLQLRFSAPKLEPSQAIYVVGRFNDWQISPAYQMQFDPQDQLYHLPLVLKQGVYDYRYVLGNPKSLELISSTIFDGTYFETENTYEAFAYCKKEGEYWDSLVGYMLLENKSGRIKD